MLSVINCCRTHLKPMWIRPLINCIKKWKMTTSIRCCLLEICAVLIESSSRLYYNIVVDSSCTIMIQISLQSWEQWKDVEFTRVLCTFMASSTMAMDIRVIKILLSIANDKMLAAEIYPRVATLSKFVNQLSTLQSLEVITLCIFIKC